MAAKLNPIPEAVQAATPYLIVNNAVEIIEFYQKVFGATETMRFQEPSGRIGHAELKIAGAKIMLSDEYPDLGFRSPKSLGGARSPVSIHLYVDNVDKVYQEALDAGATSLREPADQFYGDRNAQIRDPSGHCWDLAMRIEEVSPSELEKRFKALVNPS